MIPSVELRELRREIFNRLEPITYNYPAHDSDKWYDFHITLAYRDVGDQYREILNYVNDEYNPVFDEYATRITSLNRRKMMWEYDLPRGELMTSQEATTRFSWEGTMAALEDLKRPDHHNNLAKKPGFLKRLYEKFSDALASYILSIIEMFRI